MTPLNSGLLTFVTALGAIGMKTAARHNSKAVRILKRPAGERDRQWGIYCCTCVFHSEDADQYPARGSLVGGFFRSREKLARRSRCSRSTDEGG